MRKRLVPRFFIVCNGLTEISLMMDGGWTDLLRGAKFNNLTVIDGHKEEDRHFYNMLCSRRKKAHLRERKREAERFKRFDGLSFQYELQGDSWEGDLGDRCGRIEFDDVVFENKRDRNTSSDL